MVQFYDCNVCRSKKQIRAITASITHAPLAL